MSTGTITPYRSDMRAGRDSFAQLLRAEWINFRTVRGWVIGVMAAAGAILGAGLANKHSIGFFALALVIGALLSGGWRALANWWFLGGFAIAAVLTIPDLWWQAQHGWATITMTQNLNQENGGLGNIHNWVTGQLVMTSLALIWVWIAGLRFLWRSGRPLWRGLAWAYGLLFVFFMVTTGAKIYYLAGAYVYLLAAGAMQIDGWLAARPGRLRNLLIAIGVTTTVALPLTLPVLPAPDIGWTYSVNQALGEEVGWPELVHSVRAVWQSIPPQQRRNTVIYTAEYGEAGAINELGRSMGLPAAVSGHNTEWWWGPGNPHATTVVAVAPGPIDGTGYEAYLRTFFRHVRVAATLSSTAGSTTRSGTATSTSAPARATPGASYGHDCATTADSRHSRGQARYRQPEGKQPWRDTQAPVGGIGEAADVAGPFEAVQHGGDAASGEAEQPGQVGGGKRAPQTDRNVS